MFESLILTFVPPTLVCTMRRRLWLLNVCARLGAAGCGADAHVPTHCRPPRRFTADALRLSVRQIKRPSDAFKRRRIFRSFIGSFFGMYGVTISVEQLSVHLFANQNEGVTPGKYHAEAGAVLAD